MNLQQAIIESGWIGASTTIQGHQVTVMEQLGPGHAIQIDERDLERFDRLGDVEARLQSEFSGYLIGAQIWSTNV